MRRREEYDHSGPERFGDAELLSLVLGTGACGRSTLSIAADLLDRFGGLAGVARADPRQLRAVAGLGPARAVRLHAALQAGRRSLRTALDPGGPVATPGQAFALLAPPLRGLLHEELHGLYLDARRNPVGRRLLTRGSAAFTVVDPRQVFRPAVALGARAVILAHNHPSGDPTPSAQDREVTRRCAAAGRVLGIELCDHLVVGDGRWVSLAEEGECAA